MELRHLRHLVTVAETLNFSPTTRRPLLLRPLARHP